MSMLVVARHVNCLEAKINVFVVMLSQFKVGETFFVLLNYWRTTSLLRK